MRLRAGQLRRVIREEFLRGVPDWALRQASKDFTEEVRQYLKKFILMNKSETPADQREALAAANDVLDDLEEEAYELLSDKLYQFSRRV